MSEEKTTINQPDRQMTYEVDGVKVIANLFFAKQGRTVEQAVEDYMVRTVTKEIADSR